jgi:hypothetical protein
LFPATRDDEAFLDAVGRARVHLAGHLQRASGAAAMVTAEATGGAANVGYQVVLRVEDQQYLYYVRGDESVLLANDEFAFADAQAVGAWHAIVASLKTSADDANFDGRVDGADLDVWRMSYGFDGAADSNGDGATNGFDFISWQRNLGKPVAASVAAAPSADFDGDADADGNDFLAWQRGLDSAGAATSRGDGDADNDLAVNGQDLEAWRAAFGAAHASESLAAVSLPIAALDDDEIGFTAAANSPAIMADLIDAALALALADASASELPDGCGLSNSAFRRGLGRK